MTTTIKTGEAGLLNDEGFSAAIEAAQEANRAGLDDQEQLAAAIVAYCTYIEAAGLSPSYVGRNSVGRTPAEDIAHLHAMRLEDRK